MLINEGRAEEPTPAYIGIWETSAPWIFQTPDPAPYLFPLCSFPGHLREALAGAQHMFAVWQRRNIPLCLLTRLSDRFTFVGQREAKLKFSKLCRLEFLIRTEKLCEDENLNSGHERRKRFINLLGFTFILLDLEETQSVRGNCG